MFTGRDVVFMVVIMMCLQVVMLCLQVEMLCL